MLHQFADSIQGSLAEQGVAKYLNTYFASHVNTFTMPDLMWEGKKIQVRCQKPKEKWCLNGPRSWLGPFFKHFLTNF